MNNGSFLNLLPPLLLWNAPHDSSDIGLLMHYLPTQLTNLVKGVFHPASAERSNGFLRSNCWELVPQTVGYGLYKIPCVKMNFSPWVHPYNGKHTEIFSTENSFKIMESYQVFLLSVFNTAARTRHCSQAVQSMGGGQHVKHMSWPFQTSLIFRRAVILSFSSTRSSEMHVPNDM